MPKPRSKRSGPPHNPGVRNLASNLRRYHTLQTPEMAKLGFRGWHERGFLPHYDVPNVTQFVKFGLADSIPAHAWEHILAGVPEQIRRRRLEAAFDQHYGACYLRRPGIAELVQCALLFFHGHRYELRAWSVMPNHVQVLITGERTAARLAAAPAGDAPNNAAAPSSSSVLQPDGRCAERPRSRKVAPAHER